MRHNARPFHRARHQPSATMGIGARAPILEVPSDRYSAEPTVPLCSPPPYTPRCADHQGGPAAQPELRRLPGLRQTVRVRPVCGKQFEYDLTEMRVGKVIDHSNDACVVPRASLPPKTKVKYALLAVVPAAVVLGAVLTAKKKAAKVDDSKADPGARE